MRFLVFLVTLAAMTANAADSAISWPRVAFPPWPVVTVSKIKDPAPDNYVYGVAGAIAPKKLPEPREIKYCNVRGQYGVWERVPC